MAAVCALALVIGCSSETESGAVERVTLNAATLTLSPGATGKLTATVLPENADDKTVTWSSSDTEVATVGEDGTVTAVSIGEANITARAGGKEATCAVTVCAHSYSGDRCTKCGFPKPVLEDGEIDDDGVLTKYSGIEATVVIPDGVTAIEYGAFEDCASLVSVTIPDSVTSNGGSAFEGCTSLTDVTIPEGVTSIGNYAFYECESLTSVTIPASVVIIGRRAFGRCTSLTEVKIPGSVTDIGRFAFSLCRRLKTVEISDGVKSIGNNAFWGCTSLASVTIPDGVTSINLQVFSGCTSLVSVVIPASVTSIWVYAFDGCTSLTTINYIGTEEDWNAITKGSPWDDDTGDYTITYNYTE